MTQAYSSIPANIRARLDVNGPVPPHRPELGPCWVWTGALFSNGYGDCYLPGRKHNLVHRVIWEAVFGPIPEGFQILHKCDLRRCGRPDHLFQGTQQDNVDDMFAKGRQATAEQRAKNNPIGEAVGTAKLTELQVLEIRDLLATGTYGGPDLAERFGVHPMTIAKIRQGVRWGHIAKGPVEMDDAARHERISRIVRGERHGMVKLTEAQVREIRDKLRSGSTRSALAPEYGVSRTTISMIASGRNWKHIA